MKGQHKDRDGQAVVIVALSMIVLCGMLALGVDVGMTTSRYQLATNAAQAAARSGAYTVYGKVIGTNPSVDDATVWGAMSSTLAHMNLSVRNTTGSAAAPSDPCTAGYAINQVAITATYLDAQDTPIASPIANTGSTSPPGGARGVLVALGTCQPAAFGAVIGHPRYTIWVNGWAGNPKQGTPGPATATSAPTNTAVPSTATSTPLPSDTPTSAATPTTGPYAASGAPGDTCAGGTPAAFPTTTPTATANEFYCPGAINAATPVVVFATGKGLGNNYGHDSNFKGYVGPGPYTNSEQTAVPNGNKNGGPSAPCPPQMTVSIISGVDHQNANDYFVVLATVVIDVIQCGDPTTGTIARIIYDPYHIVQAGTIPATATPTNTATPTYAPTPTNTPTSTPMPTSTPTGPVFGSP